MNILFKYHFIIFCCLFLPMDVLKFVVLLIATLKVSILMEVMALEDQLSHTPTPVDDEMGRNAFCEGKAPSCNLTEMNYKFTRGLICGQGCCSETLEADLLNRSQNDFIQSFKNILNSTSDIFSFHKSKFEDYFTWMLDQSSNDLHNMFVKTYGLLYQQNSDIFIDLFQNFHQYFKGTGNIKLTRVLKKFFSDLLQRIFILLNAHHEFNDNYLSCVADSIENIQPFGDVPSKLLLRVKHLFVAARTLVQGLAFGANAIDSISKVRFADSCIRRVTRMMRCSLCSGFPCAKPCLAYCTTVTSSCLQPFYADLNATWIVYVDGLVKMSERLEEAFSLANVVDPIEVTISDAIMNFQTHSDTLSAQIFSKCGQPEYIIKRKRRNSVVTETLNSRKSFRRPILKSRIKDKEEGPNHLDQFLHLLRSQIKKLQFFWRSLVKVTCDKLGISDGYSSCWNGTNLIQRKNGLNAVHLDKFLHISDVDFHSSTVIQLHLTQLQAMTVKLNMAANGLHSTWSDDSEIVGYSGESGNSGGSGSDSDDEDEEEAERPDSGQSNLPVVESFEHLNWQKTRLSDDVKVNIQPSQHPYIISTTSIGHHILFQHSLVCTALLLPFTSFQIIRK